jgi:hypothetical protein
LTWGKSVDFCVVPTLRRGSKDSRIAADTGHSRILLESESPYASRRVTVECDGSTTSAYLHDATSAIASTWIANHGQAPASADPSLVHSGQSAQMPTGHTKLPGGRPVPEPATLSAVWLEEGDGAAILENGELLAVLPGWSDSARRMPGYSRDIIGQTPFGWSLDDAMEGLGARADQSARFWHWRQDDQAWARFQQAMLGHLLGRLGPGGRYWDVGGGKQPLVGVSERPQTAYRNFTVLSTIGMCSQRMPVVEQLVPEVGTEARIELAIATTLPSADAARIFLWLAQYPWRDVTWLGDGHTVRWYHEPSTFPLGGGNEAVLLLDGPASLLGPEVPDLSGFSFGGDPVRWLWVIPITERERLIARERGTASLVTQLAAQRRSWVVG